MSHKSNHLQKLWLILLRVGLVLAVSILSSPAAAGQGDAFWNLGALVAPLRFYENGRKLIDKAQRVYLERFPQSTTRFIYWELDLDFAPPRELVHFAINSVWYGPKGEIIANSTSKNIIQPNWVNSWYTNSWGWDTPGHWKPGVYWVVLNIGGRKVAQGSFEIVADVDDFQNLHARARPVRFYESGPEEVAVSQRVYRKRFLQSKTAAIAYELDLDFAPPHKVVHFELNSRWYDPEGKIIHNFTSKRTIKPNWNNSYHGDTMGWDNPGHWQLGTYRVVLNVNGREVAQGSFEIVADRAGKVR